MENFDFYRIWNFCPKNLLLYGKKLAATITTKIKSDNKVTLIKNNLVLGRSLKKLEFFNTEHNNI